MQTYPVHYFVERPERCSRVQLLIRLIAFIALGILSISFGGIFWFGYLVLPVYAASRLSGQPNGNDECDYPQNDGKLVLRIIHWFAAISGWAALVVDKLPGDDPDELIHLSVDPEAKANASAKSAILRIFTGLPSALVFMLLAFVGSFVWLWAALTILVNERIGAGPFQYLVGLQRWCIRLLLYQASLVDEYPPFSFYDKRPDQHQYTQDSEVS